MIKFDSFQNYLETTTNEGYGKKILAAAALTGSLIGGYNSLKNNKQPTIQQQNMQNQFKYHIERPAENTWIFQFHGNITTEQAQNIAEQEVTKELLPSGKGTINKLFSHTQQNNNNTVTVTVNYKNNKTIIDN